MRNSLPEEDEIRQEQMPVIIIIYHEFRSWQTPGDTLSKDTHYFALGKGETQSTTTFLFTNLLTSSGTPTVAFSRMMDRFMM